MPTYLLYSCNKYDQIFSSKVLQKTSINIHIYIYIYIYIYTHTRGIPGKSKTFFFPDGLINLFLHSNMFTVMANLQIEN